MQTLGQRSYGASLVTKILPEVDYDKVFNKIEHMQDSEYRYMLALAYTKEIETLKKLFYDN